MAIVDNCEKLFGGVESKISKIVKTTTTDFRIATKAAERMIGKNILFSFVMSLVLLAAAMGGYLFAQNYRDGTKIAEAKAVEALAEERAKFEAEIKATKKQIEQNAIASYKKSDSYRGNVFYKRWFFRGIIKYQ